MFLRLVSIIIFLFAQFCANPIMAYGQLSAKQQAKLDRELLDSVILGRGKEAFRLLTAGANVNCRDETGDTPLIIAVFNQDPKIVQALINRGANVHFRSDIHNITALAKASGYPRRAGIQETHQIQIVRILLKAGANPNVRTDEGYTPIMMASGWGNTPIVMELLAAGADISLKNRKGKTALQIATSKTDYVESRPYKAETAKIIQAEAARVGRLMKLQIESRDIRTIGYKLLRLADNFKQIADYYHRIPMMNLQKEEFHSKHGNILCLNIDTGSGRAIMAAIIYLQVDGKWRMVYARAIDYKWNYFRYRLKDDKLLIEADNPSTKGHPFNGFTTLYSVETSKLPTMVQEPVIVSDRK